MDFIGLLKEGGFIMVPLLVCSVLVWAVAIEKFWFLGSFKKQMNSLYARATVLIADDKLHEAKGLGHSVHPLISSPYAILFEDKKNQEQWEQKIGRRLVESQHGLKRSLWIIGTIGSASPFIGLFGTVVGIIKSFDSIAVSGKSGFAVVASGLSEALIATASGILVAVVSVILYNYFLNRLSGLNSEFRHRLEDLMDLMN